MISSSLNTAVNDVLKQGCIFLDRIRDETYARPLEGEFAASLGAHYRHVLDHFLCLAEGIRTGQVNYDQRRRNPQLESSVTCARLVTEGLIDEFGNISHEVLQRECAVTYSVGYGETEAEAVRSNLAREIMFCVGHATHHYAILRLLCAGVGVKLPYEFGVAPTTLKHLETESADRNRNIESGDYPVRKGDMDHLEFITLLLDKGAKVNTRVKDSTETRTVFTNQWLDENGATAFLRASQSGDLALMKLLLARGADPKINTLLGVTALHVAAGIGWVEGITYEWSQKDTLEAVKMLLDLGLDPNAQADTGRVALHGAAHKGATAVVQLLADHGAKLDVHDYGNTDNRGSGKLAIHTWQPVDYADGLVRVGVQSAIAHPETGLLLRKLMTAAGLQAPPMGRTLESICITEACE